MGRDYRPVDLWAADQDLNGAIRKMEITMHTKGGREIRIGPSEKLKSAYPELSFLFADRIKELAKKMAPKDILKVEERLEEIISTTEASTETTSCGTTTRINVKDRTDDAVHRWFVGALDPDFYYHERNDEAFFRILTGENGKSDAD